MPPAIRRLSLCYGRAIYFDDICHGAAALMRYMSRTCCHTRYYYALLLTMTRQSAPLLRDATLLARPTRDHRTNDRRFSELSRFDMLTLILFFFFMLCFVAPSMIYVTPVYISLFDATLIHLRLLSMPPEFSLLSTYASDAVREARFALYVSRATSPCRRCRIFAAAFATLSCHCRCLPDMLLYMFHVATPRLMMFTLLP